MRLNSKTFGQGDYEVGDVIVYETRMGEERVLEVEQKNADMNPCDEHDNRAGFDGTIVESECNMDAGDGAWGYDNQITEVRG